MSFLFTDCCWVVFRSKENFWRSVVKSDNFMCVNSNRNSESPREAEISQFYWSVTIDEKILRFEITMEDSVSMAERDALQKLPDVRLDERKGHRVISQRVCLLQSLKLKLTFIDIFTHKFSQVHVDIFKHKIQLFVRMDNINQRNDIRMIEFL